MCISRAKWVYVGRALQDFLELLAVSMELKIQRPI